MDPTLLCLPLYIAKKLIMLNFSYLVFRQNQIFVNILLTKDI
jgi:hypothetical protein